MPTGTWNADPVHSDVGFRVKHMAVGTFKGGFSEFTAEEVTTPTIQGSNFHFSATNVASSVVIAISSDTAMP